MASSEDEDLKLAISLSLRKDAGPEVIDLDSDEGEAPSKNVKTTKNEHAPASSLGFLGIDRQQMEMERLARKRKVSISPPSPRKAHRVCGIDTLRSPQHDHKFNTNKISSSSVNDDSSSNQTGLSAPLFLKPTVKKTWAFGYPPADDDIKLEEVLQKTELNVAVLSSFQWDVEWLLAKLDTTKTQITLVMQAKEQATKEQYRRETADMQNLRLCFPPMEGQVNCMHSKLMLLSYPTHLRVVVPTANLVRYDWGEFGDMENTIFLIDLPRLSPEQRTKPQDLTAFGRELIYFAKAIGLEQSIVESISSFDFVATKAIRLVHTIGGAHAGDSWRRTGYCGLGKAVRELKLETGASLEIDYVTSSVGSLNMDFLTTLYLAAQGDDGNTEYGWRNPNTERGKSKQPRPEIDNVENQKQKIRDEIHENFHIYFPTHDTVKRSTAGYAGTICFQSKWYNSPTFPRQALRDCKSTRTGLLMHNKIIYVRQKNIGCLDQGERSADPRPWAYVGSANCSESAWGKLSKDRVTKAPKLNCRNWECGVLLPVQVDGGLERQGLMATFAGTLPVPMQYPGEVYGDRKPWYYAD